MTDIRSIHTLHTSENVTLEVELAGIARRVLACLLDFIIQGLIGLVLVLGYALVIVVSGVRYAKGFQELGLEGGKTLMPLLTFALVFGYHFLQEWLWSGRTLGKAVLGMRVLRKNGQPIGFWEALGRNLFRIVDVYVSAIGLIPMLWGKSERRFGDYLAGTIVVLTRSSDKNLGSAALSAPEAKGTTESPEGFAQGPLRMTPQEYELLQRFRTRREKLLPEARTELDQHLKDYFLQKGVLGESGTQDGAQNDAWLDALCSRYRQ